MVYLTLLTGTPGTGKSSVAQHIQTTCKIPVFEINQFVKENELFIGYDHYKDTIIIDEQAVNDYLTDFLKNQEVVCFVGHSITFSALKNAQTVFVLRCDPAILRERLQNRGYTSTKIDENVDVEIMQICLEEARAFFKESTIIEINTAREQSLDIAENICSQIIADKRHFEKNKTR